jgi:hypothetical protein
MSETQINDSDAVGNAGDISDECKIEVMLLSTTGMSIIRR